MIHRPLITLLISYLLGLLLGNYLYLPAKPILIVIAALLLVFLGAILLNWKRLGIVLFPVVFVLIGSLMMNLHTFPFIPHNHISKFLKDEDINIQGTLYEPPKLLEDRSRFYIDAERVYSHKDYVKVTGKILLTIGETATDLRYGDRVRFICKLQRARNLGNPGGFDYSRHLALQGIFATGYLKSSKEIIRIGEGESNYFWKIIEGFREKIRNFIDKRSELPNMAIIKALLLGEQGEISEKTRDNFAATGVVHILSVSGLHLAFVAMIAFLVIMGVLRVSERLMLALDINKVAAIFTLFPVLFYAFMAGFGVATFRATIMIVTFLIAVVIDRQRDLYNTLAMAAFIITVILPTSIFDISFQLSFISVLAILYLTPRFTYYLSSIHDLTTEYRPSVSKKIGRYFGFLVLVSIAATIGTGPITAYHFNRVLLLGFIPNIVVVPIIDFLTIPLCLFVALTIFISPSLASILLGLDSVIVSFVVDLVELFTYIPGVSFWVTTPTLLEMFLFYLLVVFLFNINRLKRAGYITLTLLVLIAGDYSYWYYTKNFNRNLRVTFLSVGQGDSALIEFPKGKRMIIDGGGSYNDSHDPGRNVVAPFLWKEKIKKVDYLVLSHLHPDHLNGLRFIARNFGVKEIWSNGQSTDWGSYLELMEIAENKGIKRVTMNIQTPPMYINGVRVDIYNPPDLLFQGQGRDLYSSLNNNSLVVKLTFNAVSFLFAGDIEEEAEKRLVQLGAKLESTVIKVPHHGSLRSSAEEFLANVHPSYAVFSVGYENRFGFPKVKVLEKYRDLGSRIYRTDTDGAITMVTDGVLLRVKKFL